MNERRLLAGTVLLAVLSGVTAVVALRPGPLRDFVMIMIVIGTVGVLGLVVQFVHRGLQEENS